jgi:hypothetical protein
MQRIESRVVMNEAQHEAIRIAANKSGMALATFLRWCALREADRLGVHAEQPKVDVE